MPVDFKKQFKEFYLPPATPGIVTVPAANFLCVRGAGDPNEEDGAYAHALKLLYGVAYTIKMSPKAGHAIDGYFEYVVPPLEGFWWIDGLASMDVARKADLSWMSCIRLPDFARTTQMREPSAERPSWLLLPRPADPLRVPAPEQAFRA